jgi:hypothetical protein
LISEHLGENFESIKEIVSSVIKNDIKQSNNYNNLFGKNDLSKRRADENHHGVVIGGHRGGSKNHEPENTLRAFERAIDLGV